MIGILFFGKGFLLTRLVLENKSECRVLPNGTLSHIEQGCWHPKTFDKAVIILIDALRYDFTVPFQPSHDQPQPSFYHDALSVLYETAVDHPRNAFLLPFIADPPTTTLQRLKGLTTGSLPTFIEAGTNFAGSAIDEDNLIRQLTDAGKTVVHLGDDTWHALFPGHFEPNLTRAYDSFNVRDLHTLDNGVIEHLFPDLTPAMRGNWDVIVAHFLGVDHAGHRYGPDHPAMSEKLRQMDSVIRNVTAAIDDSTLLVVMGDHGMDSKGDHGGESDDEVEAALWMYSRQPRFGRTHAAEKPPATAKERPVRQIDLVSTFSLLLGLPIPFNNLGSPIEEAFTGPTEPDWKNLATVNLLSFQQMEKYQLEYSRLKELDPSSHQIEKQTAITEALKDPAHIRWERVYQTCREWQKETLDMYRRLWANFNIADMIHGVELSTFGLFSLLLLARCLNTNLPNLLPRILRAAGIGFGTGFFFGLLSFFLLPNYLSFIWGPMYCSGIGGWMGILGVLLRERKFLRFPAPMSFWSGACLLFTITLSAGFAANSFTIHEDTILLLFLTTFGLFACISSLRQASRSDRILGTYHSLLFLFQTRVASYSKLCREEQIPGCRSTFYATSTSSTTAMWQLVLPYAVSLVLPEIIKAFYRGTASYEGSAGFCLGFCFRMGLLGVALVWTIDAAENGNWLHDRLSEGTLRTIRLTLARGVLAIALPVGLATFIWAKPCINLLLRDQNVRSGEGGAGATTRPQLAILGYANLYGARYALLLPVLTLCVSLTLPPMGQAAMAICTWQVFSLLEILDTNGLISPAPSTPNPPSYSLGPTILAMLGSYHFFKTGHSATLASIQWSSPFIALRELSYPWAPLLLFLNTFGPQLLCAAAVPLTVLWKRPFHPSPPSSSTSSAVLHDQILKSTLTHLLYHATHALATTLWAAHLRRHLMLYRVFMPRYLMANLVLLVVDLVLLLVSLPAVRVVVLSIGEIFGF